MKLSMDGSIHIQNIDVYITSDITQQSVVKLAIFVTCSYDKVGRRKTTLMVTQ